MILVTGGTGYIGSHTAVALLNAGYEIAILDNLSNSNPEVIHRIRELTEKEFSFYEADLLDAERVQKIFAENPIEAVIHFAGLKAVGESVRIPLKYYQNNLFGTINLLQVMQQYGVKKIVFSSSATVYGAQKVMPLTEDLPLSATNPYGRTKLMIEQMLEDVYLSDSSWSIANLRYFNPVGAHVSGRIGEDPNGIPNNLVPYISQVAIGKLQELKVYGDDYPTPDGTGIRDYIHVEDLAQGHVKAIVKVLSGTGIDAYNLGTGVGYSVLDMIHAFERASGKGIPYKVVARRPGDAPVSYSDPSKATEQLGWSAEKGVDEMCADTWRWQSSNPNGYSKK